MKDPEVVSRSIKLQHLKVLMAVAQSGSMAKAAKRLAVSQPVVSKVIADFEAVLDVRLFDRTPHGVEPTFYGQALLKRGTAILDDVRTSVEEIRFLSDPTVGELRLGSTEPLLAGVVTATIERIWRQHPGVALRSVQADSATLIHRDLSERRIELAVIPIQEPFESKELEVTVLYRDYWHVVAGMKSSWLRRRKLTLADLLEARWCATPLETSIGSLLVDAFRASGLNAPRLTVSSVLSPPLVARLLEDGELVAVMADSLLNFFYAGRLPLKRLPVRVPIRPFAIAIVTAKNRTISPVARLFIDFAREVASELEKQRATTKAKVPKSLTRKLA